MAALAGALALHAGVLGLVVVMAPGAARHEIAEAEADGEAGLAVIELIALGLLPPEGASEAPGSELGARREKAAVREVSVAVPGARLVGARAAEDARGLEGRGAASGEGPAAASIERPSETGARGVPATSADEYAGPPPALPILSGGSLAGGAAWSLPGAFPEGARPVPAPTTSPRAVGPAADVATRVVQDLVRARDRSLGLGDPGATTARNAVVDAVRASALPPASEATFVVRLGADGTVVSVRAEGFRGGDVAAWDGIAKSVAGQLAGQKLRLAGNTHGATVRIALRSAVAPISGETGSFGRTPLPKPLPDGIIPKSEPIADLCTAAAGESVRPKCITNGLGGDFDRANNATQPHRMVKASFTITLTPAPVAPAATSLKPLPALK